MTLYRIYTENKNRKEIIDSVAQRFDAFTVIDARGYWKGVAEYSLIVEILTNEPEEIIQEIALEIRDENEQEAVLIVSHKVDSQLI